jgi:hypothetical protein
MAMTKKIKEGDLMFQAEMKVLLVFNGSVSIIDEFVMNFSMYQNFIEPFSKHPPPSFLLISSPLIKFAYIMDKMSNVTTIEILAREVY